MSVIHINQIKSHITSLFSESIDMTDVTGNRSDDIFNTRALAAYTIHYLSQADIKIAGASITDGGKDNGLDAVYYDEDERRLYMVQSKWIKSGKGEPDLGAIKKFIGGITDLINLRFDRFDEKVNKKKNNVLKALDDPISKYSIVIVYTSTDGLAEPAYHSLQTFVDELNDASEVVELRIIKQQELHKSLTISITGEPIDLSIKLKSWGKVEEPYTAYYGQVCATQIAEWWSKYHTRLFAGNLRSLIGDTDINLEIRNTLSEAPNLFWYFNNGITMVARSILKSMAFGTKTDIGDFKCENVSIVNGAQTVGTIGRFSEKPLSLIEDVYVPIRIISISNDIKDFGVRVTKANNRQNRIENRDFVTLDPEQSRLRTELALDGITYHVIRSENFERTGKSFELVESTTALACASGKGYLAVQLKREISRLWEDINRAPYRELFNKQTRGIYVWNCVKVQRLIENSLKQLGKESNSDSRRDGIIIHGNRIISSLVFSELKPKRFDDPSFEFNRKISEKLIDALVLKYTNRLVNTIDVYFQNSLIPTLFKNQTKCNELISKCKNENNGNAEQLEFNLF